MMSPTIAAAQKLAAKLDSIEKRRKFALAKVEARYNEERGKLIEAAPDAVLRVLEAARAEEGSESDG